jgi:DNA invertase Pin-like site-specific DNA recombinase
MAFYAYIRVSTREQSTDRQHQALNDYAKSNGIKITPYEDKASGKDFDRAQYQALKQVAKSGDIIIIKELDRLGRNYEEIKKELAHFQSAGIKVRILDLPLLDVKDETLSALLNNLMIELLSYIAQKEREKTISRVREGVAYAIEHGTKSGIPFGRPAPVLPEKFEKYYQQYRGGEIISDEFARLIGKSRSQLYRYIREYEKNKKAG